MLLYLTSNENIELLDFLQENMIIKKLPGEFYIKKFVIYDMKSLDHYSYVVIDLESIKDEQDEIIEALTAFKTIYNPKLILIAKNAENILISRIVNEVGIYNIITAKDSDKIQENIKMCLGQEDRFKEQVIKYVKKLNLKYSFTNDNVKIFVSGVMSKFGTTKTAINLATFLADIGAKVSYTEANGGNHLSKIASYYDFKDFSYMGVEYYYNGNIPLDCDFNIIDIGLLKEKKLKAISSSDVADVKILCGATKQSELEELIKLINLGEEDINIILSSISERDKNNVRRLLKHQKNPIYFSDDTVELFDVKNSNIYKDILSKYIIEKE